MSSDPLIDIMPIMKREQDGAIITQFDYPMCEALGLVKMDFLGLRNLTVLDDALDNIKRNRDIDLVLEDLTFDDPATYELLSRGDTLGVFQLDGGPMRALLRSMKPDKFEDISAVGALYRPGPMGADSHNKYAHRKNGREPIDPIHPELAEPLETGARRDVRPDRLSGAGDGDRPGAGRLLPRTSRQPATRDGQEEEVRARQAVRRLRGRHVRARLLRRRRSRRCGTSCVPFSDYAFNKAHSAAYGVISYWTAYLKANYPAEYMAALLTSTRVDKDKSAIYLNECRRMGIKVLPPDVNESVSNFASVGPDIRFGLGAIRNIGEHVVAGIVEARTEERAVRRLRRLPRQGPDPRLQQARARLADQGRRVRLARTPAAGAGVDRRGGRRPATSTSSARPRSVRTRCSAAPTTCSPASPSRCR